MIQENAMPAKLLSNIFSSETAPYVHVYTSGFSCKPFSKLHHGTKLLQEEQARIFFAVVQRIACIRPACFVLENVLGISRAKAQVLKTLQEQGYAVEALVMNPEQGYAVEALVMNPVDLGEPVQRPRYYFIGARLDVCTMPQKTVHAFLTSAWAHIKGSGIVRATLADRLLPAHHPSVQRLERARKETWAQARDKGFPDKKKDAKRSQLHVKFAALHGLKQPRPGPGRCLHGGMPSTADRLHLHVPREREAWALLSQQYEKAPALVADLSQNVDRAAVRTDGLHRQIHQIQEDRPVEVAANSLADDIDVLCFDEFQITDIQDAAILPRLFEVLFLRGVSVVMTSNTSPQLLYSGGLNRHVHLPSFVSVLGDYCLVLGLGAGGKAVDYRRQAEAAEQAEGASATFVAYLFGDDAENRLFAHWEHLANAKNETRDLLLTLPMGRSLRVRAASGKACLVHFEDLCAADRGEADFAALAERFRTVLLAGVPRCARRSR
eukprot:s4055_g1.t1